MTEVCNKDRLLNFLINSPCFQTSQSGSKTAECCEQPSTDILKQTIRPSAAANKSFLKSITGENIFVIVFKNQKL